MSTLRIANCFIGLLLLVHCAEEEQTIPQATKTNAVQPAHKPGLDSNNIAESHVESFSYSPLGKRDPFKSYLTEMAEQRSHSNEMRKKEDTELYDLEQYKLTAIITGTSQPKAMVEDPTGRGLVLKIGSRLGKNGGKISRISAEEITVTEQNRDPLGKRVLVPLIIKLPKAASDNVGQR